jgi:UDP-2,3-diacylglucosamine hydrolase
MESRINPTALFVADTHFHLRPDHAEEARLRRFLSFLDRSRAVDHLFLLGDIFDFWFDYPHFRLRGYDRLLQALDAVRGAGVRLHFVGGNHDIWASDYMHERYGTDGDGSAFTIQLGQRKVHLCHGDGLFTRDLLYRGFRALVRHRTGVLLAKSLHPELLYAFSTWLSGNSRQIAREEADRIDRKARVWLSRQAETDWDLAVIGHIHYPLQVVHGGRTLASVGGWLDREGYGILENGHFALRDFRYDSPPAARGGRAAP